VRPFLSELGLDADTIAKCYSALRGFVRAWETWCHQDEDDAPFAPHLAVELTNLLDAVRAAAGTDAVSALRATLALSMTFDRVAPWRDAWSSLLRYRLARHWTAEKVAEVCKISPDALSRLFVLAGEFSVRTKSVEARIEKAEDEPLEGWDAEAYGFYRWEDPDVSPLLSLELFLCKLIFDEVWWKIVDALTPAELDELVRWGVTEVVVNMRSVSPASVQLPPSAREHANNPT
jgi:AraC-like DNA-binding protein